MVDIYDRGTQWDGAGICGGPEAERSPHLQPRRQTCAGGRMPSAWRVGGAAGADPRGVNANLLRKWIKAHEALTTRMPPKRAELLPVIAMEAPASACPSCGALRSIGEDVSEALDFVPQHWKVIRHVRPKCACDRWQKIVQTAAPSRPIARGMAGAGLLAHVLVSKSADCLPPRQSEIYARDGVEIERSTLAD